MARGNPKSLSVRSEVRSGFNPETEMLPFVSRGDANKVNNAFKKYSYAELVTLKNSYEKWGNKFGDEKRLTYKDTADTISDAIKLREAFLEKIQGLFIEPFYNDGFPSYTTSYDLATRINKVQLNTKETSYEKRKEYWDNLLMDGMQKITGVSLKGKIKEKNNVVDGFEVILEQNPSDQKWKDFSNFVENLQKQKRV